MRGMPRSRHGPGSPFSAAYSAQTRGRPMNFAPRFEVYAADNLYYAVKSSNHAANKDNFAAY
jgi:hypothetical protein